MGTCFSITIPCDQVENFLQWLCVKGSYIHNLHENLTALQKDMKILKAKRDDVLKRVEKEGFLGRHQRFSQVKVWLTSVLTIENQFDHLISTKEFELQRLCICGFCSKNSRKSYRYGKKVVVMLKEVEKLCSQGVFDMVTMATSVSQMKDMPIPLVIVGQQNMLEKVWNRLMDDEFKIMGLYGMGGVGKTTLLKQINNKFSEIENRFDIVIWVVVSKNLEIRRIQQDIGKKLGLGDKEWDLKNEDERAFDIYNVLKKRYMAESKFRIGWSSVSE